MSVLTSSDGARAPWTASITPRIIQTGDARSHVPAMLRRRHQSHRARLLGHDEPEGPDRIRDPEVS
jgi:hypothetical protein